MSKQKNPIVPNKKTTDQQLKAAPSQHAAKVLPKQATKTTTDQKVTPQTSYSTPATAGGSQIRTLPKQGGHLSVFGTPLVDTKVSRFTVRSTLPSKQTSLPVFGAATKGASNFTIRSALPEAPPVKGKFCVPPPRATRFDLVRRVFYYLSQLLCLNFLLIGLCCYLSGFTQWGKLMIILGCCYDICLLTALTGLLIQCDLTALFSGYYLVVIAVIYIMSLIPYIVHESSATQCIFEIAVCLIDLFFLAMTTQMTFGADRAKVFHLEHTVLYATLAFYLEVLVFFFFFPYLKIVH